MINAPVAYLITAFVCAGILGYAACGLPFNTGERKQMKLNEALKSFREEMGLAQSEMAELLGIGYDHMAALEDSTEPFDQAFQERFADRVGIGLECYLWCKVGDPEALPAGVVMPSKVLTESWQRRIDSLIENTKRNLF